MKSYEQLALELEIMDELIEQAYEGMIIIDSEGKIVKFKYEKFLNIKEEDALGRHVTEVIENTRLHIVLKTGEKELGDIQMINGHRVITSRFPIYRKNKIIGAVGTILFKDIEEVHHMSKHLSQMKQYVKKSKPVYHMLGQSKYSFSDILTHDVKMKSLIQLAKQFSESQANVYIYGDSGTGKEFFAHAIHQASHRRYGPFVRINCASIPEHLFESEMFGYEAGAFTGASNHGKVGKFEIANGGTIFLDELTSMPLDIQAKLLRVLEEREFERIGGHQSIKIDVRFISAANEQLEEQVKLGRFRQDLYYRLNVFHLHIPPLCQRKRDIQLLMHHFLDCFNEASLRSIQGFSLKAIQVLESYAWPGNVRELRNAVEHAVVLCQGDWIQVNDLPETIKSGVDTNYEALAVSSLSHGDSLGEQMDFYEREIIRKALKNHQGNKVKAAKALGIHRTALYKKMKKLGIAVQEASL